MSFYKNFAQLFRKVESKGFDIPVFLSNRTISVNDSPALFELFTRNNITRFNELTPEILREYLKYSYPSAITAIELLGLYGVKFFSEKLRKYSAGSEDGVKLLKYPRTNDQLPIQGNISYERESILLNRYLTDHGLTTYFLLDGINIFVLAKSCNIDLNILEKILSPKFYENEDFVYTNEDQIISENIEVNANNDNPEVEISNSSSQNNIPRFAINVLFTSGKLSRRSCNALTNAGYFYLNELFELPIEELYRIEHLGRRSVHEIVNLIQNIKNNPEECCDEVNPFSIYYLYERRRISIRSKNALEKAGYKSITELVNLDLNDLKRIPSMGTKSALEIEQLIQEARQYDGLNIENCENKIQRIPSYIANSSALRPEFSVRLSNALKNNRLETISDILSFGIDKFSRLQNVGRGSVNELKTFLYSLNIDISKPYEIIEVKVEPVSLVSKFQNLADKIESFKETIRQDERKWDIFLGRIASKKKTTLREFAEKYNLTRERVRQIEVKQEKKLLEILNAYGTDINSIFDIYGDIVSASIPEFLPIINYIVILNNITAGNDNVDYSIDADMEIFLKNTVDLGYIFDTSNLEQNLTKDEVNLLLSDRLKEYVKIDDENSNTRNNFDEVIIRFTDNFIKNYLEYDAENNYFIAKVQKDSEKILETFNMLYPNGAFLRKDADTIFSKIQEVLPEIDLSTPNALASRLAGNPKLILVDIGKYCSIDTIHYSDDALNYALQLCKEKLSKEKHSFLIDSIYDENKSYFNANGIFSNYLLFSLLKRKNDPSLTFKRLTISSSEWEKTTQVDIFESFFTSHEGIISSETVEKHFHSLGWDDLRIANYLGVSNNVFRTANGYFHKNRISFNKEKLEKITAKVEAKVEENGFASLEIIRKNNFADWISVYNQEDLDAKSMAAFIKAFCPDFRYSITSSGVVGQNGSSTPKDVLYNWINNLCKSRKWVTSSEINNFCEANGFHRYNVKGQIKDHLLEIAEDCWITDEYAGVDENFEETLLNLLEESFKTSQKNYLGFAEIIAEKKLPALKNGCEWTSYLMKSIFARRDILSIFHLVVLNPYQTKIRTKDQLVAYILSDFAHTWYMPTEKLERLLRRNDVFKRNETFNHKSIQNDLFNEASCLELRDQNKNVCIKPEYRGYYCEEL